MKICINAGHTLKGEGSGAIGLKNESEENRKVASEVIKLLSVGGNVVIESKVDRANSNKDYLSKCVDIANKSKADLFVSIHFNAFDGSAYGVEALIYNDKSGSKELATKICNSVEKLGFKNRGVKIRPELYVLKNTFMDAIIVECCFIDNSGDMNRYDYKLMAKAIVEGLVGKIEQERLYRVCIGSYKNRDNANKAMMEAKYKGYKDSFISIN